MVTLTLLCMSMAAFILQQQGLKVTTEIMWPTEWKYLPFAPLQKMLLTPNLLDYKLLRGRGYLPSTEPYRNLF